MIRPITPQDREAFARLMVEFGSERLERDGIVIDYEIALKHFDAYIGIDGVFGLITDDGSGVILACIAPIMGTDKIMGQEIVWYVQKDKRSQGVRLLRNMEMLLKEKGCQSIMMIGLEGDTSCDFYKRSGYMVKQHSYIKEL